MRTTEEFSVVESGRWMSHAEVTCEGRSKGRSVKYED